MSCGGGTERAEGRTAIPALNARRIAISRVQCNVVRPHLSQTAPSSPKSTYICSSPPPRAHTPGTREATWPRARGQPTSLPCWALSAKLQPTTSLARRLLRRHRPHWRRTRQSRSRLPTLRLRCSSISWDTRPRRRPVPSPRCRQQPQPARSCRLAPSQPCPELERWAISQRSSRCGTLMAMASSSRTSLPT